MTEECTVNVLAREMNLNDRLLGMSECERCATSGVVVNPLRAAAEEVGVETTELPEDLRGAHVVCPDCGGAGRIACGLNLIDIIGRVRDAIRESTEKRITRLEENTMKAKDGWDRIRQIEKDVTELQTMLGTAVDRWSSNDKIGDRLNAVYLRLRDLEEVMLRQRSKPTKKNKKAELPKKKR